MRTGVNSQPRLAARGLILLAGACCVSAAVAAGVQTLDTVEVIDAADNLLGTADSASQGTVRREQIEARPNYRPGEILEAAPAQFTQSKIASIKFSLKLSEVTQVDSKDSPAVQIVDVLVGAAIEATKVMTKQKKADYDPEALIRLYREDQFIHYIPSLNFDEQKEFRKGSQDADVIDYFSKNFKP